MNIDQYNKSMDEIEVRRFKVEELINKDNKKSPKNKVVKFAFAYILIGILVLNIILPKNNSKIILTVYAADEEIMLSKDFVNFNLNASFILGMSESKSKYGFVGCNINFKCEGQDIKTITYICSDQTIDRNNRENASAYYVENLDVPIEDAKNYQNDNDYIYGYTVQGEKTSHITKIIGSSYSVDYKDQNNKQYGLVIAATIDENDNYIINDTIINIEIQLKNGSIQYKKLMIRADKDTFSDIQISIME